MVRAHATTCKVTAGSPVHNAPQAHRLAATHSVQEIAAARGALEKRTSATPLLQVLLQTRPVWACRQLQETTASPMHAASLPNGSFSSTTCAQSCSCSPPTSPRKATQPHPATTSG